MKLPVNKLEIAHAFGRAAVHYNKFSELQRLIGDKMVSLLPFNFTGDLLDAGCGPGWYSTFWRKRGYRVTAIDISEKMLIQARNNTSADRYLIGDIDSLPLLKESMDIVWSNLVVQWSTDLRRALCHFVRVTKIGGFIVFSTLIAGSLQEIHDAWRHIDDYSHANHFLSKDDIYYACKGFTVNLKHQIITLYFPTAISAMRSLKGIGATYLHQGRNNNILLTRDRLAKLETFWPHDARGYPLTYQLIYGIINK
ncbi:malonyl-ACP O-methyltransferase BioC [Candidatus Ishikawella capsulata]|nr:malonyl-ACP O-methyltransferase BioC [Candidatus Ishikawaella capsulata]